MTDTIYTSQTPSTDDTGSVSTRSVGMRFQISTSNKAASTARYWVPSAGLGTTSLFYVWNLDTATRLVEVDLNTALPSPTTGAWNTFSLGTTINFSTGVNYAVGIFIDGGSHYVFSGSQTLPVSSGGAISADQAMYHENGSHDDPINNAFPGGFFFSDLNVVDAVLSVNVGTAAELDTGLSVAPAFGINVGTASEIDAGLAVVNAIATAVGIAAELDTGLSVGASNILQINVGTAAEKDTGLAVGIALALGTAIERDTGLPIGHTGGSGIQADGDLTVTYLLNLLAGTVINGWPSLSGPDAAAHWAAVSGDRTIIDSFNIKAGNTLPNYEALRGVLNHIAGTYGLSAHDAILVILGG